MTITSAENLEAFDYIVALIFARLFERFPERTAIQGMRLVIEAALDKEISDALRQAVPKIFSDTVKWLREEGFIRYSDEDAGDFRDVTLTLRGLTVLGYVPVSLKESPVPEPMIDKLRAALKSGTKTAAHEIIKQAIGKTFALVLTSKLLQ
jgi:hypothetical protein